MRNETLERKVLTHEALIFLGYKEKDGVYTCKGCLWNIEKIDDLYCNVIGETKVAMLTVGDLLYWHKANSGEWLF